jgi:hypothetical protein
MIADCGLQTGDRGMTATRYAPVMVVCLLALAAEPGEERNPRPVERWAEQQAQEWQKRQPWLVGVNFLPSTAVNDTEMWQAESFDAATIERELGWARKVGFNSCRVFFQHLVWEADPEGFEKRFEQFLGLAAKQGLSVMPVFFDDCAFAGKEPYLGKQAEPVPGVHNSGWVPSPSHRVVTDPKQWGLPERFVKDVIGRHARDARIVLWDLYNEPGNEGMGNKSLPLVEQVFVWAREARPTQPLTVGIWGDLPDLNRRQCELSDVISFHNYGGVEALKKQIEDLKKHRRPVLCTEWMRRPESLYRTHLPVFQAEQVGCYSWGLVNGRTQTHFPWGSPKGAPEPKVWFHDLLRKDGTPFDAEELRVIGERTRAAR